METVVISIRKQEALLIGSTKVLELGTGQARLRA
jgi:hypothetical protein